MRRAIFKRSVLANFFHLTKSPLNMGSSDKTSPEGFILFDDSSSSESILV